MNKQGITGTPGGLRALPRSEREKVKSYRSQVIQGIRGLPEPKYSYDIQAPEVQNEFGETKRELEPDQGDIDARRAAWEAQQAEVELKNRSSVLRRELPRPLTVPSEPLKDTAPGTEFEEAADYIASEAMQMIRYDLYRYPIKAKGSKKPKHKPSLDRFSAGEIEAANALLQAEAVKVRGEKGSASQLASADDWWAVWLQIYTQFVYSPSRERFVAVHDLTENERIEALQSLFERLTSRLAKDRKKGDSLRKKLDVLTKGLQTRSQKLDEEIDTVMEEWDSSSIQAACYKRLADTEERAVPLRVEAAQAELHAVEAREEQLQLRYKELQDTIARLKSVLV